MDDGRKGVYMFVGVVILMLIMGYGVVQLDRSVKVDALSVSGEVTDAVIVDKMSSPGGAYYSNYYLVYEFENGNSLKEKVSMDVFNNLRVGTQVEVCFNSDYYTISLRVVGQYLSRKISDVSVLA